MLHLSVFFFIILIAVIARHIHTLSTSGAIAAVLVGNLIYLGFGVSGLVVLGVFFSTSSFLSFFKKRKKFEMEDKLEKGSRRDWLQVLANGGVAGICGFIFSVTHDQVWVIAFLTSLACATGDTWSSEIGPLSKYQPISVKTFKHVAAGTSGAISVLGTVWAILGVLLITIVGMFLLSLSLQMACFIFIFGILGNGIDTYIGAFLQRRYRCIVCSMVIEKNIHCENRANKLGGYSFMTNDAVNFLATLVSPLLAVIIYHFVL
jgi:uncharacterized protein (TIGR00297 family)